MKRVAPWVIAVIALSAFAASFSELQSVRAKLGAVHEHQTVRATMIIAALSESVRPLIVIGDSIAEMAPLPLEMGGHKVVNAGIGGITSQELTRISRFLLDGVTASLIVLAIGANDVGSSTDYPELLLQLKRYTSRLLVIPSTSDEAVVTQIEAACRHHGVEFVPLNIRDDGRLPDGIHLNMRGYRIWMEALAGHISG
jgi:lysophospholipase L1-like esterase